MNAKQFLESKGIYSLDTKKRTNEVIQWMEDYAALKTNPKEPETVSSHEAEKEEIEQRKRFWRGSFD